MQTLLYRPTTVEEITHIKSVYVNNNAGVFNYQQIDTIRFITICFIVWGHCLLGWDKKTTHTFTEELIKIFVLQTGRISTIIFFIVSGFLLKPKLQDYTVSSYFKKRLPKIYLPWFISISIIMVLSVIQLIPLHDLWVSRDIKTFIRLNYNILNGLLLYSSYWFITTYMAGMAILIFLKNYVNKLWLGLIFLTITLFYCLNLHYVWIDPNHEKAILAYTFFIWLGVQINTHSEKVYDFLNKISWPVVIGLFIGLFILASYEGHSLTDLHLIDAYASNRFTNSILSVFFFLALLKMGKISFINKLNPRHTVYGIYLIHNILIFELVMAVEYYYKDSLASLSVWNLLAIQVCFAAFVIALCYKLVKLMANSKFKWAIGIS